MSRARLVQLESHGATVSLEVDLEVRDFLAESVLVQRMIPSVHVSDVSDEDYASPPDVSVTSRRSELLVSTVHGKFWTSRPEDVVSISEGMLEARRQSNSGCCALHASAVVRGDVALVLFGADNVGKSALALELRNRGWLFTFDDKVLLAPERREVAGGRPWIRAAPHLVRAGLLLPPEGSWRELDRCLSEALPKIALLVRPVLAFGSGSLDIRHIEADALCWELYPRLSEAISLPRQVGRFGDAFPGCDNRELSAWRARAVRDLCKCVQGIELVGTPSGAAAMLDDIGVEDENLCL